MNEYDLLEEYEKVTNQSLDIETLNSFSKSFNNRMMRQPIIYMLFKKYSRVERIKFLLDLKKNNMGITELNEIVNLKYIPGLYRKFFLHPYYEFGQEESERNYGGMSKVLEKKITADGWERLVADSQYVNAYRAMYKVNEKEEYSWVDIRWRMVESFIARRKLKVEIMRLVTKYRNKLKCKLDKNLKKNPLFEEILEWINVEQEMEKIFEDLNNDEQSKKKKLQNVINESLFMKDSVFRIQFDIHILAARDFWCAFLIEQSIIKRIYEKYRSISGKSEFCPNKKIYYLEDSMEKAYLVAWGEWNQGDFNIRKNYIEIVMKLMGKNDIEKDIALRTPATWLLGNSYEQKKKAKIKLPRCTYLGNDKKRRDNVEYNIDILMQRIVEKWNDEATLYDRAVNIEALSIEAHVNDIFCKFGKAQADIYFDIYLNLYMVAS